VLLYLLTCAYRVNLPQEKCDDERKDQEGQKQSGGIPGDYR
jgi:hypothetical protein